MHMQISSRSQVWQLVKVLVQDYKPIVWKPIVWMLPGPEEAVAEDEAQGHGGGKGQNGMNSALTQQPGEQEQYKYCVLVHNHYIK